MIIESLMTILKNIYLTINLQFPQMPDEVSYYVDQLRYYIGLGYNVCRVYFPMDYFMTLFFIVVGVDVGVFLYKVAMWIIRKIPLLNIK